ncbi:MAG TPA: hypothetical protein VNA31_06580, partial [bacterium]|nr:hypothetical protein [bacterium]
PQITALVAGALLLVEGLSSPVAAAGLEVLRAYVPDGWSADCVTDALTALHQGGVPEDDPLIATGLQRLVALQRTDGGWSSEFGADHDVDLSLRAFSVLLAHGVCGPSAPRT